VWRGGEAAAEQGLCAAKQGEAGGARVCGAARGVDGCRGVRGVLNKGRRVTWACVPREGRGEFLGEDRGFGCAGEGDGSGRWARAVSG